MRSISLEHQGSMHMAFLYLALGLLTFLILAGLTKLADRA
jgi:hypothetical protein